MRVKLAKNVSRDDSLLYHMTHEPTGKPVDYLEVKKGCSKSEKSCRVFIAYCDDSYTAPLTEIDPGDKIIIGGKK